MGRPRYRLPDRKANNNEQQRKLSHEAHEEEGTQLSTATTSEGITPPLIELKALGVHIPFNVFIA